MVAQHSQLRGSRWVPDSVPPLRVHRGIQIRVSDVGQSQLICYELFHILWLLTPLYLRVVAVYPIEHYQPTSFIVQAHCLNTCDSEFINAIPEAFENCIKFEGAHNEGKKQIGELR